MAERVGGIFYDVTLDTSKLVEGQRSVNREVDKAAFAFNRIASAVKVYAAALAALKVLELADQFKLLSARVEVAAGNIESGAAAFSELVAISKRTQSSLEGNIAVFTRLNQSILQMGGTQQDTLQLTELLAKAIKVSGANAIESKAAMLQFGQALGSGKLAGDELRSLLETAPYLMRQLADGLGVPIGALKQLGEDGKLTADVVVNALSKAADKIDADFRKFPQTIESAMVVARDQAGLAAMKFDELSGSSAVLTGITQGLGEVFEKLADQFGAANTEAGNLSRNDQIRAWADRAREGFSYLADAADLLWQTLSVVVRNVGFVAEGVGAELRGVYEQAKALARGDFAEVENISGRMKAMAALRRKELDDADAETLRDRKLWGQQMREAWAQGAGGGRGFVNPALAGGKGGPLKPPGGGGKGDKFDSDAYLAGLLSKTQEGMAKVDAMEQEALRKNAALLAAGKITRAEAARAATLIEQDAAQQRLDIQLANAEAVRAAIEAGGKAEIEERRKIAEQQVAAQDILVGADPIAQAQLELERKSALLAEYAAKDQENAALYAEARVALEKQTAERIREIVEQQEQKKQAAFSAALQNYASLFDNMAGLAKTFSGKQSALYKTMFAVSKAFAIADSIIKIQQGIANAAALPFPANLGAMATVAASTANIISTIQSTKMAEGRQYGGPVSSGSLYRVNEQGRPEMFTAANGSQYMLPTANGNVTPANQVGNGGGGWTINVNNAPPGTTATVDESARVIDIAVARAEANFVDQVSNNSGPQWAALRGATNVSGRF